MAMNLTLLDQIDDFIIRNFGAFAKPVVHTLNRSALIFRVLIGIIDRQIQFKALYNSKLFMDQVCALFPPPPSLL